MNSNGVGILGAGTIGRLMARYLLGAGYEVALSNSRGPSTLGGVVRELGPGASAATAQEAAAAEVVLLAVPWRSATGLLESLPPWGGRILVDATNAVISYTPEKTEVHDFGSRTSSEVVAAAAATARVVKAFNTLPYPLFVQPPRVAGGRRVMLLSGDQADAKQTVSSIIERIGYAPVDLGPLAEGSRVQQAAGPLAALDLRLGD
ncbi:NADPH-dependent F420 reductase [Streptomyces sp. NPDC093675]|uniref:NADPH-dependent F420 reductase n=1 Tax=Streptomyces sp. NPDC093675 TaxID=3366049 RepID=UPI00381180E8